MLKQTIKLSIQSTSIIGRVGQLVIDLEEVGVDPPYVIPSECAACAWHACQQVTLTSNVNIYLNQLMLQQLEPKVAAVTA